MEAVEYAPIPGLKVIYNKKDITRDITEHITSFKYSDRVAGESDELSLSFWNEDLKWIKDWYPQKGDTISLAIGIEPDILPCGDFEVDEFTASGTKAGGDVFTIKAVAAGINSPLRSKKSRAFENQTLRQIAEKAAKDNGLKLVDGTFKSTTVTYDVTPFANMLTDGADRIIGTLEGRYPDSFGAGFNLIYEGAQGIYNLPGYYDKYKTQIDTISYDLVVCRGAVVFKNNRTWFKPDHAHKGTYSFFYSFANFCKVFARFVKSLSSTTTSSLLNNIVISRVTQNNETDLAFLLRVGRLYGFEFSVRGEQLIFMAKSDLLGRPAVQIYTREHLLDYSIKDKANKVYKNAIVKSYNPVEDEEIEYDTDTGFDDAIEGPAGPIAMQAKDRADNMVYKPKETLVINKRVDNKQQAELIAWAAINDNNSKERSAEFRLPLSVYLVAGNNFIVADFGVYTGTWHIKESTHEGAKGSGCITTVHCTGAAVNQLTGGNSKLPKDLTGLEDTDIDFIKGVKSLPDIYSKINGPTPVVKPPTNGQVFTGAVISALDAASDVVPIPGFPF